MRSSGWAPIPYDCCPVVRNGKWDEATDTHRGETATYNQGTAGQAEGTTQAWNRPSPHSPRKTPTLPAS